MKHCYKSIRVDNYTIGFDESPDEVQQRELISMIEHPEELLEVRGREPGGRELPVRHLSGRSVLARGEITGVGSVVMKTYGRGGILRHFIGREHFRVGRTRAEHEFRMLAFARRKGVSAPEPVAWVSRGKLIYHAWLVTREINGFNLAELTLRDGERARNVLRDLTQQMNLLIQHRVCHVDLHPGNVIVSDDDQVYLVDFDKAYFFRGRREKLREYYLRRWRRAVIKHDLPELLSELMCLHLRGIPNDGADAPS